MSSPKPVPVPPPDHVKISKTGRPYVDIGNLIRSEMERIEQSKRPNDRQPPRPANNGNGNNGQENGQGG